MVLFQHHLSGPSVLWRQCLTPQQSELHSLTVLPVPCKAIESTLQANQSHHLGSLTLDWCEVVDAGGIAGAITFATTWLDVVHRGSKLLLWISCYNNPSSFCLGCRIRKLLASYGRTQGHKGLATVFVDWPTLLGSQCATVSYVFKSWSCLPICTTRRLPQHSGFRC